MDDKPYFLITGCGSSGTRYTATVFNQLGLNVPHERQGGRDGVSCWYAGIPDAVFTPQQAGLRYSLPPFKAHTWKNMPEGREVKVLHQVRNPLKVISTVQRYSKSSWQFIYRALNWEIEPDMPLTLRCMKYWYLWNLEVEKIADFRYQVEQFEEAWPTICALIERPRLKRYLGSVKRVSKAVNSKTHRYKPFTWMDLKAQDGQLTNAIMHLGKEYGYDL